MASAMRSPGGSTEHRKIGKCLMRCCHPLTGGWVTCTDAFQFDNVIWMELPAREGVPSGR